MPERLSKWHRDEVHQITHDWVRGNCHRITNRDCELGKLLIKRKLLRRDQIPILHPGFRGLANPEVQVNRRLRILYDSHFIDRCFPNVRQGEGSAQAVIALDRAGALLLGATYKRVIKHQKNRFGGIERTLPIDYRHTLGINDFEVSLVQWCMNHEAEMLRWKIDFDNLRRFQFNGEWIIRPDGFGIIRKPIGTGKGKAFFFEYDTGTEDERHRTRFKKLTAKFKSYAAYKASGAWSREDWAPLLREFPPLVFLTEDGKRINALRELASALGVQIFIEHFSNRNDVILNLLS